MDSKDTIYDLKKLGRDFTTERDWDQFHNAKDVSSAIMIEAGELADIFRFKDDAQIKALFDDPLVVEKISFELSDVLFWVLRLADRYGIDLSDSFRKKMVLNEQKYPVEKVKGDNRKYTEY